MCRLHTTQREALEADNEQLQTQVRDLAGATARQGSLSIAERECRVQKEHCVELQKRLVESEAAYHQLKAKMVIGTGAKVASGFWLERAQELESAKMKAEQALSEAVLREVCCW